MIKYTNKRTRLTPIYHLLVVLLVLIALSVPWTENHVHARTDVIETTIDLPNTTWTSEDIMIERPPELPYLFAAFIVTWAGFFAYAFVTSRRLRETRRELDSLRQSIHAKEEHPTPPNIQ